MGCEACEVAQTNPMTGRYTAGCTECQARVLAHSQDVFNSSKAGRQTPAYADALKKVFGERNKEVGHARVKAWVSRIKSHKTQKGQA